MERRPFGIERFRQTNNVTSWLEDRMYSATMQVANMPLAEVPNWQNDGNTIFNPDKAGNPRFFQVTGRNVSPKGGAEGSFGQPGIVEVADPSDPAGAVGTVGLLVDRRTGDVLVTAAAEPFQGKPGEEPSAFISLRASVQGSYTNLTENKVPFSEKVNPAEYNHFVSSNPSRIEGKIRIGYTKVDKRTIDISGNPNARWFSRREIDQAVVDGAPFNALFHTAYNLYRTSESPRMRMRQMFSGRSAQ